MHEMGISVVFSRMTAAGPLFWPILLMGIAVWSLFFRTLLDIGLPGFDQRRFRKAGLRIRAVRILAAAAPLVGLLGTVTGMIRTFDALTLSGVSNSRAMAGGIAEALITTQAGLVVAVPGLLVAHGLERWLFAAKAREAA